MLQDTTPPGKSHDQLTTQVCRSPHGLSACYMVSIYTHRSPPHNLSIGVFIPSPPLDAEHGCRSWWFSHPYAQEVPGLSGCRIPLRANALQTNVAVRDMSLSWSIRFLDCLLKCLLHHGLVETMAPFFSRLWIFPAILLREYPLPAPAARSLRILPMQAAGQWNLAIAVTPQVLVMDRFDFSEMVL